MKHTIRHAAIPVSGYEDELATCEHGDGLECEERARAWTIKDGSGYVVACAAHAQEILDAAIANGDIEEKVDHDHD